MRQTKTLAQVATEAEENMDVDIEIGGFKTFADFMSYFNRHYKPLLKKINSLEAPRPLTLSEDDTRLLTFFADDMLDAFSDDDDNNQND